MRSIAIIGASPDKTRMSNKAVRAYKGLGYNVYPVNPNYAEIEGIKTVKTIGEIKAKLDVVSVYVKPEIGLTLVSELAKVKPKILYLNPGSESDELVAKLKSLKLDPLLVCSIRALGLNPDEV